MSKNKRLPNRGRRRRELTVWSEAMLPERMEEEWITAEPTQADELDAKMTSELLAKAIGSLRASQREVIRRRFYEDETLEQTAKSMGVNAQAVRRIEQIGICKLYVFLRKHFDVKRAPLITDSETAKLLLDEFRPKGSERGSRNDRRPKPLAMDSFLSFMDKVLWGHSGSLTEFLREEAGGLRSDVDDG